MGFQTALSGLTAAQSNLDVIGNNIANSSTTGFKKSRAEFADIYAMSFAGSGSTEVGTGVRLIDVSQQFAQGNIEWTENSLDLAIAGEGFFALKDTDGSSLYTRSGAFGLDREGYVVNSLGQRLQKYDVDSNGLVTNFTPSDLRLTTGTSPASSTQNVEIKLNLNASDSVVAGPILPGDPTTYNYSTSTTVYDSLGVSHTSTLYFRKTAPNTWESMLEVDGATFDTETLTFNTDGTLATAPTAINFNDGTGTFNPVGANPMTLTFDFNGTTQYAGDSTVSSLVQDGYSTGRISSIDIDDKGIVFARYTNGQAQTMGAVGIVKFGNPQGLQQMGDTTWAQTLESGDVIAGQAGVGSFGQIKSGALESSNVDISQELVDMIVAQRDYQANAKMISTEDQITQTIINIR